MSKEMKWTYEDIGKEIDGSDEWGSFYGERIVLVHCEVCGAEFIGTMREAGGFLGGHHLFHNYETKIITEA